MSKEGDMSLFNDVLEPFRRVINTDPPKDKLSASTKLNFSDSNQSIKEGLANLLATGKRKSSLGGPDNETPQKRLRTESNNSPSAPPSPWECKRTKIELIAAKAQVAKLEARVNHQHTIRKEMQILFEEEKQSLLDERKRLERALSEMDDKLNHIRRREQELKDELSEINPEEPKNVSQEFENVKHDNSSDMNSHEVENKVIPIDKADVDSKERGKIIMEIDPELITREYMFQNLNENSVGVFNEADNNEQPINAAGMQFLEGVDFIIEAAKEHKDAKARWEIEKQELLKQIADLKDKLLESNVSSKDQISEMKKDMDELLQALEGAQSEVEMLKKEVSKQTSRAEQCTTLRTQVEKQTFELQQLNSKLKELEYERDSYKDWQQQAKTAQKRLSNMAELEKEVVRLRATERSLRDAVCNKLLLEEQVHQLTSRVDTLQPVQQDLHEAKVKLASLESALEEWTSAARTHGIESARALSTTLDSALSNQLTAAASNSQTQSQFAQLTEEVATVKYERDKATSKLNELTTVRKNQESLIHRLQKRLLLVTRERDSYRQQLDCYEKELTVSLCGEAGAGSAALLSARVEQLEKALQGYRDLLAQHDQHSHQRALESLRNEVTKWREEAEAAKRDAQKLRAHRDSLHAHLEKLTASAPTKVLHLTDNPAAAAQKQIQVDLETAQEEIKNLKAALREGGAQTCPEEVQQLKQQLESSRIKLKRMKEEFTSSAQEYRDACYMLLGYKVDRTGHKNYRISNMYAESAEEYLTFTLNDEDGIEMVHTDYSATLSELVELHLHHHRSIPMFLSALTMELFTRTTMQQTVE